MSMPARPIDGEGGTMGNGNDLTLGSVSNFNRVVTNVYVITRLKGKADHKSEEPRPEFLLTQSACRLAF